ncbi:MAG: FAD-binding oxidoreductase [Acidobacteriota bacterium]|nr:FAD-binding oxidoreductase [Acidobacteriota bacterium]
MRIVEPQSEEEAAEILRAANEDGASVIPRGGGTKSDWGNPPRRTDVMLSTVNLNRVIEHAWADLTVTVEAGCTIAELQRTLAQHGQRLAVDPLWPEKATVGGVVSTNDTGALRLRYGGLRDLIIGVTLALADGTLARSGGKVVKNVAGYDLSKLVTGAFGTLAVITSATFRLHPLPKHVHAVTAAVPDLPAMQHLLNKILETQLVPAALQVRVGAGAPQIDVLFEGTEEGIYAQVDRLREMTPLIENDAEVFQRLDAGAKISVLPARIAETLEGLDGYAIVQATGIGWVQSPRLSQMREKIESMDGSLVLMRPYPSLDAWGSTAGGDALPLMRAIKQRFDSRGILNPGVFVGGI